MVPFPYSNRSAFLGFQSVFTPPLFRSYFAERLFGFAVWGENLADVSQFVAEIRPSVIRRSRDFASSSSGTRRLTRRAAGPFLCRLKAKPHVWLLVAATTYLATITP